MERSKIGARYGGIMSIGKIEAIANLQRYKSHQAECSKLSHLVEKHQSLVEGMTSCKEGEPWNCKKHHPESLWENALEIESLCTELLLEHAQLYVLIEQNYEITQRLEVQKTTVFSEASVILTAIIEKTTTLTSLIHEELIKPRLLNSPPSDSLSSRLMPLSITSPITIHPAPKLRLERHQHCLDLLADIRLDDEHLHVTAERLESIKERAVFKIFDENYQQVASRPYFHLYFLHRKECPEKADQLRHGSYGGRAFKNKELGFSSTLLERQRVVARTQVEVALHGLDEALRANDCEQIGYFLKFLETIQLDARDGIGAQRNIAHYLFHKLHEIYKVDCDKAGSTLPKPQEEFGRNGYIGKAGFEVNKSYRLAAFEQVITDLRAAWKIF